MFIYEYLIAIYGLWQPMELWTGKQLFSVLVRPNAKTRVFVNLVVTEKNYNKKADIGSMCPSDGYVCFRNSELISGQLGKATLGRCSFGLFSWFSVFLTCCLWYLTFFN